MLTEEEISERNGYLIALITKLELGIHVVELPHKPKLLSNDYTRSLNAYVRNFHLILKPAIDTDEVYFEVKLKPIDKMNLDEIKEKFLEWMVVFEHKRIYTISLKDTRLLLTGFNHHNKLMKTNPYPVFAQFDPLTYHDLERAEDIVQRFDKYELKINM